MNNRIKLIKLDGSYIFKLCIISLLFILFNNIQNSKIPNDKKIEMIKENIRPEFIPKIPLEFSNILPRTNLNNSNKIPTLNEIFNSRELYISTNNITNKYINYIRRINKSEEKIYKKKLFPGLKFD